MSYPCHVCANTMIHGVQYTFPRKVDPTKPSCGKVYWNPSWAASAVMGPTPPDQLVDCWRCKGTGRLDERRKGTARRSGTDRRSDIEDYQ